MAGHSHWAGIKHKKALIDAKRGKVWSKMSKAIIVAAKSGGGDVSTNLRLRYAIEDAKSVSMPKENIQRAIKKGAGDLDGVDFEEVIYEGYGPGGVAVLCETLTDNRNRTAPEIRKCFELSEGKLGSTNCVAWMFHAKGLFLVPVSKATEDELMELALEAGAEDVRQLGDNFEIVCGQEAYEDVKKALAETCIETEMSKIARVPENTVDLDAPTAQKVLKLMERLDDHDDVQSVSSNFNIPDDVMAELAKK